MLANHAGRYLLMVCFLGLFVVFQPARAAVGLDLYKASAHVADQGAEERQRIMPQALGAVVDRVSGSREWRTQLTDTQLTDQGPSLLEEFRYESLPQSEQADSSATADSDGPPPDRFRVFLRFSEKAVNRWLIGQGVPVWNRERPLVLGWVGIENRGRRELIGEEGSAPLTAAADYWGVPLRLPVLDLEDRNRLSVGDLWGFFGDSVVDASQRYAPDAVLMAKLFRRSGRWTAQWQLRDSRRVLDSGELENRSLSEVQAMLMEALAGSLSQRLAVVATESADTVRLEVSQLDSYADFGRCQALLAGMAPVKSVSPYRVTGTTVFWELNLLGTVAQLEEYLALSQSLQATVGNGSDSGELSPLMAYRWTASE